MALQPSLRALIVAGNPNAPHTLDVFRMSGHHLFTEDALIYYNQSTTFVLSGMDMKESTLVKYRALTITISARMANGIQNILKPKFEAGGEYEGKAKVVFRLQVQPWHSASTLTHEAGLAVRFKLYAIIRNTDYSETSASIRFCELRQTISGRSVLLCVRVCSANSISQPDQLVS